MAVLTEHRLRIGERDVTLVVGPAGWGEWSLLEGYPCDPAAARRAAYEAATRGWPEARRDSIPVNALVTDRSFDPDALRGYPAVKVKVQGDGVDLVAAVRDAVGPRVKLRVDANASWDVDTAVAMIGRLARYDLELVEQPVATLEDLAHVRRRVDVPVAADESVRSVDDALRLRALEAADAVVLKVQPLGGVRAALTIAEAAGVPAIPSSMMETSVGLAAGVALAAALPELPFACGLATATLLAADVTHEPLFPVGGEVPVRRIEPSPDLLVRYQSASSCATSSGRSRCTE